MIKSTFTEAEKRARTKTVLAPCKFCGGNAVNDYFPSLGSRVKCSTLHCKTCTEWKPTAKEAQVQWEKIMAGK